MDSSTITVGINVQQAGIVVPFECKLIGFSGNGHRYGHDNAFQFGIFALNNDVSSAHDHTSNRRPDYGGKTDTSSTGMNTNVNNVNDQQATLRAIANATEVSSGGFNQRFNQVVDLSRSHTLEAGSLLFPCIRDTTGQAGDSLRARWTIVLATKITSI